VEEGDEFVVGLEGAEVGAPLLFVESAEFGIEPEPAGAEGGAARLLEFDVADGVLGDLVADGVAGFDVEFLEIELEGLVACRAVVT